MSQVNHHKFVAALPAQLEADSVYYVRAGAGFDHYVTNSSGTVVAYKANSATSSGGEQVGDVLTTARNPGSLYLPLWGGVYLQSAYPELYSVTGLGVNDPATSWSAVASSANLSVTSASFFGAVAGDDDGRYIAVVTGGLTGFSAGAMALSVDDGLTWVTKQVGTAVSYDVAAGSDGVWCAVGTQLKRSTDNGETWTTTTPFGSSVAYGVATDGAGVWVVVLASSGAVAYRSADNGLTWSTVSLPTTAVLRSVRTNRSGTWVAVGTSGMLFRSTDNGLTWQRITSGVPGTAALIAVATSSSGVWVAVGSVGLRSTDAGLTWSTVSIAATGTSNGSIAATRSGTWLYAIDSTISRSLDNGLTWSSLPSGSGDTGAQNQSVATNGGGTWVVGGRSATIRRGLPTYEFDAATQFQLPEYIVPEGLTTYIRAKTA